MALVTDPYNFSAGTTADAEQVDARFAAIIAQVNGNLEGVNIKDGSIAETKLVLASDAAAGTASRRTLGVGGLAAAPGAGFWAGMKTGSGVGDSADISSALSVPFVMSDDDGVATGGALGYANTGGMSLAIPAANFNRWLLLIAQADWYLLGGSSLQGSIIGLALYDSTSALVTQPLTSIDVREEKDTKTIIWVQQIGTLAHRAQAVVAQITGSVSRRHSTTLSNKLIAVTIPS